ncbi:MAG TPA: OmpA family protein [Thermoanaerobaculia bacterium]|nr:OmpA family protein [Thermoanaerobaculia bacterium]
MKSRYALVRALACAAVVAMFAAASAYAADFNLSAVTFPDGTTIDLPMARTGAAPNAAKFEASVKYAGGQAKVEVSFKKMEPAILFGGDISSYVVWAVTRDGAVENLGELIVEEANDSGSGTYSTPKKQFGILVTAEPYYLVGKPGDLVVASSGAADAKKTQSTPFVFNGFRTMAAKADVTTIATLSYKDKKPVCLVQAERAVAVAQKTGAAALNPKATEEAQQTLAQAENSAKGGGSAKVIRDYSRRTVALSAESMRDYGRKLEADAEAAKKAALAESQMNVAQLKEAQAKLEADKAKLLADQAQLKKEKAELEGRLKSSMALIGDTRDSARGAVMSLPGISFETGKAVLKTSAQLTLAKLAGIAQVFPAVNMRVEGYTDSTGNAAANQKLSEARAKAVYDFLKAQGVADTRLAFQGLGPASPVADNATKEGRAKNRRVEIVAAVGEIKPVSAN